MQGGQRAGGLRTLALVSGVYDLALAVPMLLVAPRLAEAMGAPPPVPLINAQLNLVGNELAAAASQTRQFNLRGAEYELREAERRHAAFKRKYEAQLAPTDSTFAPPLRKRERVRE